MTQQLKRGWRMFAGIWFLLFAGLWSGCAPCQCELSPPSYRSKLDTLVNQNVELRKHVVELEAHNAVLTDALEKSHKELKRQEEPRYPLTGDPVNVPGTE